MKIQYWNFLEWPIVEWWVWFFSLCLQQQDLSDYCCCRWCCRHNISYLIGDKSNLFIGKGFFRLLLSHCLPLRAVSDICPSLKLTLQLIPKIFGSKSPDFRKQNQY
jgi:hypothetical protein